MILCVVGLDFHGLLIMGDRFRELSLLCQGDSIAVVCARGRGFWRPCPAKWKERSGNPHCDGTWQPPRRSPRTPPNSRRRPVTPAVELPRDEQATSSRGIRRPSSRRSPPPAADTCDAPRWSASLRGPRWRSGPRSRRTTPQENRPSATAKPPRPSPPRAIRPGSRRARSPWRLGPCPVRSRTTAGMATRTASNSERSPRTGCRSMPSNSRPRQSRLCLHGCPPRSPTIPAATRWRPRHKYKPCRRRQASRNEPAQNVRSYSSTISGAETITSLLAMPNRHAATEPT